MDRLYGCDGVGHVEIMRPVLTCQARIDRGGGYKTTKNNHSVFIHPSSCLVGMQPPPRFILYYELVLTSKEYMRQCMPIEGSWLAERESYSPHHRTIDLCKMRCRCRYRRLPDQRASSETCRAIQPSRARISGRQGYER